MGTKHRNREAKGIEICGLSIEIRELGIEIRGLSIYRNREDKGI